MSESSRNPSSMDLASRVIAPSTASGYAVVEPCSLAADVRAASRLAVAALRPAPSRERSLGGDPPGFEAPLGTTFLPGSSKCAVLVLGPDGGQAELSWRSLLRAGLAYLNDEILTYHLPRGLRRSTGKRSASLAGSHPLYMMWSRRFVHFLAGSGDEVTIPAYDFVALLQRVAGRRYRAPARRIATPLA